MNVGLEVLTNCLFCPPPSLMSPFIYYVPVARALPELTKYTNLYKSKYNSSHVKFKWEQEVAKKGRATPGTSASTK